MDSGLPVTVEPLVTVDARAASLLTMAAFEALVAPGFAPEGVRAFTDFARPYRILERNGDGHATFVARREGIMIGVAQLQFPAHLRMLFVDPASHGTGVGRIMLALLADIATADDVTVYSSEYAVPFYARYGFVADGDRDTRHGMVTQPMRAIAADVCALTSAPTDVPD